MPYKRLQSKPWRKAELTSAAQVEYEGVPMKLLLHGEGNMLPAMFLPIAYIPLANWLTEVFSKLF